MTELNETLKGVSRSFYLSIRFLPHRVRKQISLAFLICKAADTIADTRLIPHEKRLTMMEAFRGLFRNRDVAFFQQLKDQVAPASENPFERRLLLSLPAIFEALDQLDANDRTLISELARELTQGMILDLQRFPGETASDLQALPTEQDMVEYTYYVAGCVGVFWTRMLREHFSFARAWDRTTMKEQGKKFGMGLQMVNILRDLPRDLQQGRCYLPEEALHQRGLAPHHLLDIESLQLIRPYLLQQIERTRELLACGRTYAAAHPWYASHLKWVVLLPMSLGYKTLKRLERSEDWLNPQSVIKVPRSEVYQSMGTCFFNAFRTVG